MLNNYYVNDVRDCHASHMTLIFYYYYVRLNSTLQSNFSIKAASYCSCAPSALLRARMRYLYVPRRTSNLTFDIPEVAKSFVKAENRLQQDL